jgi:dynein heavy chain
MDKYSEVNKIVIPKRKALGEAEAQLTVVKKELDVKEAALREIKGELARLQSDYSKAQQQLDQLSRDKKKIELQLYRAEKLVVGLADESKRWEESIQTLNEDKRNMLGNTVLAAGYVCYVGCFTSEYRSRLIKKWTAFLREKGVPFSPDWTLQRILGDSLKIRSWNIQGLPADDLSIDNGIITTYPDSRWPLIIDPQTQGNRWIKNKEKDNSLKVIKLSNAKFLLTIETSIKMGFSVLLENIGETLDPSLEPVLQKNVYKKNN